MTILSTTPVSSDVTNPTTEPSKAVKSAKQIAAAGALKAISAVMSPERGTKAKERRLQVEANNSKRLGQKLALLTAGNFEHKGKKKTLNLRQTLIEMAKAARVGATVEKLALTGVIKRFDWTKIEEPVRLYLATLDEESAKVVAAVLFPTPVKADKPATVPPTAPEATPATAKAKPEGKGGKKSGTKAA